MTTKVKIKKLLGKLNRLIDSDSHDHARHAESLEKVCRKLKSRQKLLEELLCEAKGEKAARKIAKNIAIVKAMRKKGIEALREERRQACS